PHPTTPSPFPYTTLFRSYSSRRAASISLKEVKSLITHTGTPTSPKVAAISPEVKMKSASFARPFAEIVSVASTLMSFAQPQSFKIGRAHVFKKHEVPRTVPHPVTT